MSELRFVSLEDDIEVDYDDLFPDELSPGDDWKDLGGAKAGGWDESEHPRDDSGRFAPAGGGGGSSGEGDSTGGASSGGRRERARRTHKPSTAAKQRRGEAEQARLARSIGAVSTDDNKPFDVLAGRHAIEVKTVIDNDNDKITVHPESRRRKERFARKNRMRSHTVAIDVRSGRREYYYREGVGAYRLASMQRVSVSDLRELLK